jgi:hypothetical protein
LRATAFLGAAFFVAFADLLALGMVLVGCE